MSDIHFGNNHRFDPDRSTRGDKLSKEGIRSLAESIDGDLRQQLDIVEDPSLEELADIRVRSPMIACLTGDFAERGAYAEFDQAYTFVKALATSDAVPGGMTSVFTVPGNHDVEYDKADSVQRFQQYVEFHNRVHDTKLSSQELLGLDKVYDRIDDLGALVLCINSSTYVQKNTPDEQRGQVSEEQLLTIRDQLRKIPAKRRESAVKIALIHHHPVLVPPLAEADRDYDAVQRSGQLLSLLHEYGFHLVLHGHKHLPLTFSEDMRNAFETTNDHPMMVVAGGSAGSKGVPDSGVNTYNLITVKWHEAAGQLRIRVVTRGLVTRNAKKQRMLTHDWHWTTLREDDRSFALNDKVTKPNWNVVGVQSFAKSKVDDKPRAAQYGATRGNLAVVEVRPSLHPGQAYEATFWIVAHKPDEGRYEAPVAVVWSAGKMFPVLTIKRDQDPRFCASFDYWGPMLVQAELRFAKGKPARTFVYARVPGSE